MDILATSFRGPPTQHNTDQDFLHQLPNELLLEIAKNCPDLSSLRSLVHTSPRLSSIFDANALSIVEAVLDSTVPSQIQVVMQVIVDIRTGSFKYKRLDEIQRVVCPQGQNLSSLFGYLERGFHPSLWYTFTPLPSERKTNLPSPCPRLQFPTHATPALVRKFLGLAHRIHALAYCCIDDCLQRCIAELDPSKKIESPSWVEEQRATLAFWRAYLCFELKSKQFARSVRRSTNWPPQDLQQLHRMKIENRSSQHQQKWYHITLDTYLYSCSFELHQVQTAIEFLRKLRGSDSRRKILPYPPRRADLCQTYPAHPGLELWEQERQSLDKAPPSWEFLYSKNGNADDLNSSNRDPTIIFLSCMGFPSYHTFGLAFWDEKTMTDLGLWSPTAMENPEKHYPAWRNIPRIW